MIQRFIILTLLLPYCLIAQQNVQLDEVVKEALQNNYNIKIAKNSVDRAAVNATIGQAGFLPTVDFSAGYNYSNSITKTTFYGGFPDQNNSAAASQNYNAGVNLRYTVFDGLKPVYQLKKSKIELNLSNVQYKNELQNVAYNVVQAFFVLATATQDLRIANEKYQLTLQQLNRIQIQRKYGQSSEAELLNLQSAVLADTTQIMRVQQSVRNAKRQLNRLIGQEFVDKGMLVEVDTDLDLTITYENVLKAAKQNNTAIQQANLDIERTKMDLKITNSELYPKLNTTISYGYNGNQNDVGILKSNDAVGPTINLGLTYAIYSGGALKRAQKQNKLSTRAAELNLAALQYDIEQNIKDAYARHENNMALIALERSNSVISKDNFERIKKVYELGQATYFDFQQAAFNYIQSQKKVVDAQLNAKLTEWELMYLAGKIIE